MARDYLSGFEQIVLAAVLQTHGDAYGVTIHRAIKDRTRRVLARGNLSGPHVDVAGNQRLGLQLETSVDRREYGLEWNAPLPQGGFALDNEVKLDVQLELVHEA